MTKEELKSKWVDGYTPKGKDYAELIDFIEGKVVNNKISESINLGAWNTEISLASSDTIKTIVQSPGALKTNVIERIFVAIELDSEYILTSTSREGEITLNILQNAIKIGEIQVSMDAIVKSVGLFEIPIDYANSLREMEDSNIEFSMTGIGKPTRRGARARVKVSGFFQTIDSFKNVMEV